MASTEMSRAETLDGQPLCTSAYSAEDVLMSWNAKAVSAPPRENMRVQFLLIAGATAMNLILTIIAWKNLPGYMPGLFAAYFFSYALTFVFILISRQKTVFSYTMTKYSVEVEYFLYYPKASAPFFKALAIFTMLLFVGAAIYTQSPAFLVGPAALALGSAKLLLGWKNESKYIKSSPWLEYNSVTIGTKRLMVVTHRTNPTVGFEARFPNKKLLDHYISAIKHLLPASAKYEEKSWNW
ncbi:permease [Pseudomonas sp. MAFF 212408]|uniref:Permease n=1 Tax=Pseudomonas kitaguniensis TaxID=2607908 RepID=A0A5N7KK51_9PSED|nr:permease [Pseudomonas kitaguniensis]MPR02115.1 permease [Pseudomonas kitaguniensis]